ncbi:MAG: pyridine nucleotide-disulfide oxidoreductase [Frankiales bacterium]|nr:pyridine nucleotide-disulfide oxidoreductase [Frankiales bacterium]
MPGVVIVGACQAGAQTAVSLRELGYEGTVTLVGAEPSSPYARPPLSKAYLAGAATAESLSLRNASFYEAQRIDLVLGDRVVDVDLDGGCATTDSGRRLPFDRLALTTGARVMRLPVPGADLDGVLYLRDLADADRLAALLPAARSVVVVGGGFIGLEAAAVCRAKGKDVTVVEMLPRLVARAVAPEVSAFYQQAHERRGTRVCLGRTVTEIVGQEGVSGVRLDDGSELPADLVLVGIGVRPRVELAEQMGLELRQGAVVVDQCARTSDPRVVAAGDCTLLPHPLDPGVMVRLESVQNAVDQAKAAAASLLGLEQPYCSVPWFWSDQDDLKLQIAGLSTGYEEVVVRGEPDSERFSALYYRAGRLIAIDCVNRTADYLFVRRLLGAGGTLPADLVSDADVPLKSLVDV